MNTLPLQWSIDVHSVHTPLSLSYQANEHELETLRRYAEVERVTSFKSEVRVSPLSAGKFKVTGRLQAEAVQASVVDLSPVPASIDETFSVEFWPRDLIEDRSEEAVSIEAESARGCSRRTDSDRRVPLRAFLRLAGSLSAKRGRHVFMGTG